MNKFWVSAAVIGIIIGLFNLYAFFAGGDWANVLIGAGCIIVWGLILFAEYLKSRRENSEAYKKFKA